MYEKLLNFQKSVFWKKIDSINNFFLILTGSLAVLLIFLTVLSRYVFKVDLYGLEEIITVVAFWLYFVGGARGSMEDSHIKADLVDVFVKNVKLKYFIKAIAKLIEGFTELVLGYLAIKLLILNFERMPVTSSLKIPFIIPQFPVAIGFLMMGCFSMYYALLFYLKCKRGRED